MIFFAQLFSAVANVFLLFTCVMPRAFWLQKIFSLPVCFAGGEVLAFPLEGSVGACSFFGNGGGFVHWTRPCFFFAGRPVLSFCSHPFFSHDRIRKSTSLVFPI